MDVGHGRVVAGPCFGFGECEASYGVGGCADHQTYFGSSVRQTLLPWVSFMLLFYHATAAILVSIECHCLLRNTQKYSAQ